MTDHRTPLSRRAFLRLAAVSLGARALPDDWAGPFTPVMEWPRLRLEELPGQLAGVLGRLPRAAVGRDGYLHLLDRRGHSLGRAPLARTLWNREHSTATDRLYTQLPLGIVLHWYGDRENFDRSVPGYLRGFDDLRLVGGEYLRTSAHFLVGEGQPHPAATAENQAIGILQTQAPDVDGTPFVASHLQQLDYFAHWARQQYFVRALYQLGYADPAVHSILQDMFDGRPVDANMRTLAVEITGHDFEDPAHFPSEQQLANAVSVVWALMARYGVLALDLFGHHEIQLNKADPGKKFMALVRTLIGAKALLEGDPKMSGQVFGPFLKGGRDPEAAVHAYFKFVRDYLALTGTPRAVYEWERASGYWFLVERLPGGASGLQVARETSLPLAGQLASKGFVFLEPDNHEGVDLYLETANRHPETVQLAAPGLCLYAGNARGHERLTAIFRHRQPDGAEFLTVYGHLGELGSLKIGQAYPPGYRLGAAAREEYHPQGYLHFAVAYGATWDSDLQHRPAVPLNAGESWIRQRYLRPEAFLAERPLRVEPHWKG